MEQEVEIGTRKRTRFATPERKRTSFPQPDNSHLAEAIQYPLLLAREINNRSLYEFLQYFWPVVSNTPFTPNWHIEYLCKQLEELAQRVGDKKPKEYDLIINVPPGSTKTITCSIIFPAWCWTKWYWMRFICSSYSSDLSLESAEYSRDLVQSAAFQEMYPELAIKEDKNIKSNFKIVKRVPGIGKGRAPQVLVGGSRYSTSVGGTLTGFHGDILIVDDPINPKQAASDVTLATANHWVEQTLSTRKTDKAITPTILIMQRLHQDDPSGHMLAKEKENVRHISIPGECRNYKKQVKPESLLKYYKDDLMDPKRMPWTVLRDMEADLGQYGYAGQVGQDPTPPGGGMFKVDFFMIVIVPPPRNQYIKTVRYWDKAATAGGNGAFTAGVKMSQLTNKRWIVEDVKRGRWATNEREKIIRATAEADGSDVEIWIEQEPGSGGKDSVSGTTRNLAGFVCRSERPTGDKAFRADPYSVQVNDGAFLILAGMWNRDFIEEHRFFPYSTYKDQVDASSGAFNKLVGKKVARRIT